jgi:hypothetical protein
MITSLITFAVMSALPLLLATAVAVLSHDPQRRADARRVVVLLRRDQGQRKTPPHNTKTRTSPDRVPPLRSAHE